jgi:hypothetical protein
VGERGGTERAEVAEKRAVVREDRGSGAVRSISDGGVYNVTGFNVYKGGSIPSSQTQP